MLLSKFKGFTYLLLKYFGFNVYTKKQKRVLKNFKIKSNLELESVIFFTTHKCASNFSNEILKSIEFHSEYNLFDYGAIVGSLADKLGISDNFEDYLNLNYQTLFYPKGELYGPQRKPLNFPGLENFKKIIFLRDPRDVLVSSYYSFGYSHNIPDSKLQLESFNERRNRIQNETIDEYVLRENDNWIKPMYKEYEKIHRNSKNILFLSYQDFVENTKNFIDTIFEFLNIYNEFAVTRLVELANPIQNKEDINKHKRSGRNFQWKEELTIGTQNKLNKELDSSLKYWKFKND
jgi:hypothetical protein